MKRFVCLQKLWRKSGMFLFVFLILGLIWACNRQYTPKPKGYYRISFPEHSYQDLEKDFPYDFEIPVYANVVDDKEANAEPFWININYPQYKGKIHISYKKVNHNLSQMLEDSRKLAYKHSIKADAIGEKLFLNSDKKVYGILYDIKGDAASSVQFSLTDSLNNFLRGSLYFDAIPNKDSLAPVVNFVREDIIHMMETFEWKSLSKE